MSLGPRDERGITRPAKPGHSRDFAVVLSDEGLEGFRHGRHGLAAIGVTRNRRRALRMVCCHLRGAYVDRLVFALGTDVYKLDRDLGRHE